MKRPGDAPIFDVGNIAHRRNCETGNDKKLPLSNPSDRLKLRISEDRSCTCVMDGNTVGA